MALNLQIAVCGRVILRVWKVFRDCFGFSLLHWVICPESLRPFLNQLD